MPYLDAGVSRFCGHRMRRIVLASGKGGVGRTTLVANLGLALAKMGKVTVVVDASLTTPNLGLMFKLEKAIYTLNDVLAGEAALGDAIYDGPSGLKVIPAGPTLDQVKKALPDRLPGVLRELPVKADFLLIDAPGGLRRETVAALRCGSEVLLVANPEIAAVSNAMKTRLVSEFLGLRPIGIVLNRVQKEEFELDGKEIENMMGLPLLAEVPEDASIGKALSQGKIALDANPRSPASRAIGELAKKIAKMRVKP